MNNTRRTAFLFAVALFTLPTFAYGSNPLNPSPRRPQVLVGPTFQINRNYHSGGFGTLHQEGCPLFEHGTGWGFGIGLSAEFSPIVDGSWSIVPRVTFEQRPGQFYQELPDVPVSSQSSDPNASPTIVNQTVSTTSDIGYTLLNAEVMYEQDIVIRNDFRLGIAGGPAVGYIVSGTNRQVQDLIEPQNARFVNNENLPTARSGRQLIFFSGEIPQLNSTRFSVKAGIQSETGLFGNQWIMSSGIYYDYGLTNVARTENWGVNSIIFQIDFRRGF